MTQLKKWLSDQMHWSDFFFPGIWLVAWFHNATAGSHFDLDKLWQIYLAIRGFVATGKWTDSKYNSPPGEPPIKK